MARQHGRNDPGRSWGVVKVVPKELLALVNLLWTLLGTLHSDFVALPQTRVLHPLPEKRFADRIRGKGRVR